ncbi:MAG TPA: aminotransferase class V-fold PLP-dependent enzyme [Actinocrinis sp.]|jgi:cysteine desulfurase|uniref:cysteine desulfurase/sulfurtransferase TusA family protein n=1 Tax=Actinocrinis sp. TaxID=1920516 RepID=UPI002DDD3A2C|nr:aminotransferase class V-fold PLP-dependent enzyme [Actinocrinis sp.]HEV3171050.1 aminotransferase class V-fold PLP-dependent enzyme [Actinocrinis sp.]
MFLDAASGEPMDPVAREAYLAALEDGWADADRLYREGRRARMLLDAAREAVAEVIGARPDETVFTPSGTTAIHAAVAGITQSRSLRAGGVGGPRIVTGAVEHSAVLHAAEFTAARVGGERVSVPVSRYGAVDLDALAAALTTGGTASPAVALACVQAANHEVGTLQPVERAWELCADAGVPLLVDAAAALGRIPAPRYWSALCGSARKWGGPSGVGVLAVRKGTRFAPAWPEDERERGRSPGPVNVPAVLAAAAALRARESERDTVAARHRELVDRIRARVAESVPDVEIVGDPERRLPHIVTFSCLYAEGEALLLELDKAGFSVSSGSSCTASTLTPSHVLESMGVLSHGNVRVSLPWGITAEDVDRFLDVLPGVVAAVRAQAPSTLTAVAAAVATAAESAASEPEPTTGQQTSATAVVINALGRKCPIPVIELAKHIDDVPIGGTISVLADDVAARLDIPAWCRMREQTYLGEEPVPERGADAVAYLVRRDR